MSTGRLWKVNERLRGVRDVLKCVSTTFVSFRSKYIPGVIKTQGCYLKCFNQKRTNQKLTNQKLTNQNEVKVG